MREQMSDSAGAGRIDTLLGYLSADPNNLQLISDATEVAIAEGKLDTARSLLSRYSELAPLTDRERHLSGLVSIKSGDFQKAVSEFGLLSERHPDTPALRFNLAWSLAMTGDHSRALSELDDRTIRAIPQAAALKVQLLHDRGDFEDAERLARSAVSMHPDHPGLLAATSVLAMDIDDIALARTSAERAGEHPDALTTLGLLSLGDGQGEIAHSLFTKALTMNENTTRAWVGAGLADLAGGNVSGAAEKLQRGAQQFDSHVGSWIAAGWAHLLKGDQINAESCFQRAFDLDHNFAECQGSLAVLMLMNGREEEGRRLAEIARRLDPKSLTGALAHAVALSRDGHENRARAIIEKAMTTPVSPGGDTLAQAVSKLALGR